MKKEYRQKTVGPRIRENPSMNPESGTYGACKDKLFFGVQKGFEETNIVVFHLWFSFHQKNPLKGRPKSRGDDLFLKRPKVQAYFATQQLDTSDARELFNLLDQDGDGEVDLGVLDGGLGGVDGFGWLIHQFFLGAFTGISIGFQVESSRNHFIISIMAWSFLPLLPSWAKLILVNFHPFRSWGMNISRFQLWVV